MYSNTLASRFLSSQLKLLQIRFVRHDEAHLMPVTTPVGENRTDNTSSVGHLSSFDTFSRSMKVSAATPSEWPAIADISLPSFASSLPMLQHVMADHRAQEVTAILHSASSSAYGPESSESAWL